MTLDELLSKVKSITEKLTDDYMLLDKFLESNNIYDNSNFKQNYKYFIDNLNNFVSSLELNDLKKQRKNIDSFLDKNIMSNKINKEFKDFVDKNFDEFERFFGSNYEILLPLELGISKIKTFLKDLSIFSSLEARMRDEGYSEDEIKKEIDNRKEFFKERLYPLQFRIMKKVEKFVKKPSENEYEDLYQSYEDSLFEAIKKEITQVLKCQQ